MSSVPAYSWCRWTLLLAVIVSLLALTELSSAKAVSRQDGYWTSLEDVSKRNTWWSKKSSDSSLESQPLLPDTLFTDRTAAVDMDQISALYDCYIQSCMPQFVLCAKHASGAHAYSRCKMVHRVCATSCYLGFPMEGQGGTAEVTD